MVGTDQEAPGCEQRALNPVRQQQVVVGVRSCHPSSMGDLRTSTASHCKATYHLHMILISLPVPRLQHPISCS
eukprot:738236-Hanusia_phi.AAC.1